jgi:hypothetical protein
LRRDSRGLSPAQSTVGGVQVQPQPVLVWFGSPIEPELVSYPPPRTAVVKDPPLLVDELPGTLSAWQKRTDGWYAMVEYRYPTNGIGMQNYIGWFPATRLRPTGPGNSPAALNLSMSSRRINQ